MNTPSQQPDMFEEEVVRSLLDQLFEDSRLYNTSEDYCKHLEVLIVDNLI